MRRTFIEFGFVALGLAVACPAAERARVGLLATVSLEPETIHLSDLMPADAPAAVVAASVGISLGRAPALGRIRRLTAAEIEWALAGQPDLDAQINLPPEVTVERIHDQFSRREIAAAIGAAVGNDGAIDPDSLDLPFSASLDYTDAKPVLEVIRAEYDAMQRVTRVCLRNSAEKGTLPFYVSFAGKLASMSKISALTASGITGPTGAGPGAAIGRRAAPPFLVRAGVAAELVIEGPDYRITSTVVPLEPGVLGQQIRTRDPISRRLIQARVAGPGMLSGSL